MRILSNYYKFIQKNFNSAAEKFDILIDNKGKSYVLNEVEWSNKKRTKSVSIAGYLAKSDQENLSDPAQQTWEQIRVDFD